MKTEQIKIEFTFGTGLDKYGKPISAKSLNGALHAIKGIALHWFKGYTLVQGNGGWRNSDGVDYVETNAVLTIVAEGPDAPVGTGNVIEAIKRQLNQESVLVTVTPVKFFIS